MTNKLGIILIVSETDHLDAVLKSISNQIFKSWDLYLLVNSQLDISNISLQLENYKLIKIDSNMQSFNMAISLACSLQEEYISIINSTDIHSIERFNAQISYLDLYKSINICSCLESLIFNNGKFQDLIDSRNSFISIEEIRYAISCNFSPLNLYTLVFRKTFLNTLAKFITPINFYSEIDLILYFLKYENIIKLPINLYYINNYNGINYFHCDDDEKISRFNESKFLDNQSYFKELINRNIMKSSTSNDYKHTIVIILDSINIGGTESYVLDLSRRLNDNNIQVCIFCNYCFSTEIFTLYDIPLYVINLYDKVEVKNTIFKINNIRQIQIHMENDLHLSPFIKELFNIPITLTIHGIYYDKTIIRKYIPYIDYIIFVSKNSQLFYNDIITSSSIDYFIVPNSIEINYTTPTKISLRNMLKIPDDSFVIIYCSRLSFNKSKLAKIFLKSFYKLAKSNKNIYAIIIGNGNHKLAVELLSNKFNKNLNSNRIFLLGSKFNVLDYYFESNLVVGTGRVALEAMSLGKAVISLGLSKSPYIVNSDNINKLIDSNFGDHPHNNKKPPLWNIYHLTKLLKSLISSKEYCTKLGVWNSLYVKNNLSSRTLIDLIFHLLK